MKRDMKYVIPLMLVLSMMVIMPLGVPVLSNVAVVMHHDNSVDRALDTLLANTEGVRVVEYGSVDYYLTIHRTVGKVVWISHGCEDGILTPRSQISWESFGGILDTTPGADIVLACESDAVRQYTDSMVMTFSAAVDAVVAGALASCILAESLNPLSLAMERVIELADGSSVLDPLVWGPTEQLYFVIDFCLLVLQSLSFTFMLWWGTLNPYSTWQIITGMANILGHVLLVAQTIVAFLTGTMTVTAFATHFLSSIVPILMMLIGYTPWWIQVVIVAEQAVTIATWVKVVQFLFLAVSWTFLITGVLNDQADRDDTYGRLIAIGFF